MLPDTCVTCLPGCSLGPAYADGLFRRGREPAGENSCREQRQSSNEDLERQRFRSVAGHERYGGDHENERHTLTDATEDFDSLSLLGVIRGVPQTM